MSTIWFNKAANHHEEGNSKIENVHYSNKQLVTNTVNLHKTTLGEFPHSYQRVIFLENKAAISKLAIFARRNSSADGSPGCFSNHMSQMAILITKNVLENALQMNR